MSQEFKLIFATIGCSVVTATLLIGASIYVSENYIYTTPIQPKLSQNTHKKQVETLERSLAEAQDDLAKLRKINQTNQEKFESYVDREGNVLPELNQQIHNCEVNNSKLNSRISRLKKTISSQEQALRERPALSE